MANSNPSLQANNRSLSNSGGKPTRILKIRAKRLTSQSNLSSAVSEPMINVMSKPSSPPSLAIGRRVRKRGNSPDQVTPPPLLDAVPEYDPSNSQTPDPALSRNSPSTPVNASLDGESESQQNTIPDELDALLDGVAESPLSDSMNSIDKLTLDSGVDLSPNKNSLPDYSTFRTPEEATPPLSSTPEHEDIRIETTLITPTTEFSSLDLMPSSYGSGAYKLTPASSLTHSSSSIQADQSSTTSSVQSYEEQELPFVPIIHRRDISFEADLTEILSANSNYCDNSPQLSNRSQTVTPASERVHMVTPSDEFDPIPDDMEMLLYDLQNGQFCGYNIDLFLEHHAVLKAMYSCPQCKCIIREPHFSEWEACCRICLPKVRTPLKVKQAIFDKHLNKKIQSLQVKCPLTGRGCQWRSKLRHLEGHLKQSCNYMRFRCPHNGCDQVFYRKNLEIHVSGECGERKMNCPHCNAEVPVVRFKEHLIYVSCPKECENSEIPQCQLGLHILKQCGRVLVPCPYNSYGCEDQIPRGEIHEHMIVQNGGHLRLLRTLVDDSRSTIEKLVEENENLQAKIASGRRECAFLEKNISLPGTLLWKIPKIFHQMKTKHVVESKELEVEGYRVYALLWFGGWHSPGDVELGIIRGEGDEEREWPVCFRVHYTIIHPTDSTQVIKAESTAKYDRKPIREIKEKTWNKAQGYVGGFIPIQTQSQLHSFLMDGSLYIKVELAIVNPLPIL